MLAADPTLLQLHYRPDLNLLAVRWLRDAVSSAEVHAAHQSVLELAQQQGTALLLMDRRRITPAMPESEWVAREWLPAAARQLPGSLRLASLVSPELWQAIISHTSLRAAADEVLRANQPYQVSVFVDEGEAVRWLLAA